MSDFKLYNNLPRIMPSPGGLKAGSGTANPATDTSFGNLLKDAIRQVTSVEEGSQGELQKFVGGESDLHSVMLALEKADLSFQMMMQVRNKFVQAYQEIMKTQV
jgi:flagellar hook-basal body complex protein FliE